MTLTFAFLPNIGPLEVGIVLLIVLIIFGPKRIPAAFRSIGDGLRGFRDTVGGEGEEDKEPAALAESTGDEVRGSEGTGSKGTGSEGTGSGSGEHTGGAGEKSGIKTDS